MQIELKNISKRFNREWIIKNLTYSFKSASQTGIIGSNGSGKSTLIKLISAAEIPTSGEISYSLRENSFNPDNVYSKLSFSAPYMDIAEELSCEELFDFHTQFKSLQKNISKEDFLQLTYLTDSRSKFIKNFSSGMKQRLKLGLAICTQSEILLLDEPCSNLDTKGINMYQSIMNEFNQNRTTLIGSNEDKNELFSVENNINVLDYK